MAGYGYVNTPESIDLSFGYDLGGATCMHSCIAVVRLASLLQILSSLDDVYAAFEPLLGNEDGGATHVCARFEPPFGTEIGGATCMAS